jgi:magnesium-transporting ATPase (P-type)
MPELWYKFTIEKILSNLNSSLDGLNQNQVNEKVLKYGKNKLPMKKGLSAFKIILNQFLNPLIYILLAAGVVSVFIGDVKDSFFIFIVIILNASIGAYQEWKAEKSAESLQRLLNIYTDVMRDSKEVEINAEELVPGDIVLLESGNKVPADIRLINSNKLMVDESLLTGESVSVQKNAEDIFDDNLIIAERINMLFAGSIITSGRATGIVVETGLNTEIGKIAETITGLDTSKPPLIHRMERFAKHISYIVLIACILIGIVEIYRGNNIADVFLMIIALAVSAIPEGLPAAVTVALSVGMSRMLKRNVIIRKLTAVEALGSCTCIVSDKTGTLTVNKQTVRLISVANGNSFQVTGESYTPQGQILTNENLDVKVGYDCNLDEIIKTSVICNEAVIQQTASGWESNGDSVDIAILAMAQKYGINQSHIINSIKTVTEIPYESEIAYAARFYKENGKTKIAIKGAFEIIINLCNKMRMDGNITDINYESLNNQATRLAEEGYRLISVASGQIEEEKKHYSHEDINSLIFMGFICLIDPLRPESTAAIQKCKEAGIRVLMVTGDHPETAFTIGRQLGISQSKNCVITGYDIERTTQEEFKKIISTKSIFARVSPLQKLQIVDILGNLGNFIAVTGDGVNDAPALKKAHVGVAMGSGTDITKDVASIIVSDDNFSSIVSGIEEGRYTYDNIRKVIYLLVSAGLSEIILFLLAIVAGLPIPLVAVQLLWLNLVTNGIQGVGLAFEKGESTTMQRPPRSPNEGVFNKIMIQETVLSSIIIAIITFTLWVWLLKSGLDLYHSRNLILLLMVFFENIHVFNCRSEYISAFKIPVKNNVLLVSGVVVAQAIHLLSMHIPLMQKTLEVSPVGIKTWFVFLALSAVLLIVMELFKEFIVKDSARN